MARTKQTCRYQPSKLTPRELLLVEAARKEGRNYLRLKQKEQRTRLKRKEQKEQKEPEKTSKKTNEEDSKEGTGEEGYNPTKQGGKYEAGTGEVLILLESNNGEEKRERSSSSSSSVEV
jgi:hypothetical protein